MKSCRTSSKGKTMNRMDSKRNLIKPFTDEMKSSIVKIKSDALAFCIEDGYLIVSEEADRLMRLVEGLIAHLLLE
jgi:hypothetical protein